MLTWLEVCGRVARDAVLLDGRKDVVGRRDWVGVPTRVLLELMGSLGRSRSFAGTLVYAAAEEKYLGIMRAKSGRIAGRQAQVIPTLTSTADRVA